MIQPPADGWLTTMEATWPPAQRWDEAGVTLRDGAGGGKRVSAATATGPLSPDQIDGAEAAMRAIGQTPIFQIQAGDAALDQALDARGYAFVDPVTIYAMPTATLAGEPVRRVSAFTIWEPLAIMRDIWAAGDIGPDRIAVMDRVPGPKTAILARDRDRPAGVGFVACDGDRAMIHAIEVVPDLRRCGVGTNIMRMACHWAAAQGADWLGLAVTRANEGAGALYASLGMTAVEHYHYRVFQG